MQNGTPGNVLNNIGKMRKLFDSGKLNYAIKNLTHQQESEANHIFKTMSQQHSCWECRGCHRTPLHMMDHSSSACQQNNSSWSTPTMTTTLTAQDQDLSGLTLIKGGC